MQAGLLSLGHDIERARVGAPDTEVLTRAIETERTIVTEDKDFGDLVVHCNFPSGSVVLVRADIVPIEERVRLVHAALEDIDRTNVPVLVVISPNHIRTRPILRSL